MSDDDLPTSHRYSVDGICIPTRELRYVLSSLLRRQEAPMTVADLVAAVEGLDIAIAGRSSKTVSDALRAELARGRAAKVGWGRYRYGRAPESTEKYIRRRAGRAVFNYAGRVRHAA